MCYNKTSMKYLFEWTPAISVGDPIIDKQHQKLLAEVNVLISNTFSEEKDAMIYEAVAFLSEYIREHLAYEEKYMELHNYPERKAHKLLHDDFVEQYEKFKKQLISGVSKKELIMEIEQYIGNWWMEHIRVEDKKYAVFIREREKKSL